MIDHLLKDNLTKEDGELMKFVQKQNEGTQTR